MGIWMAAHLVIKKQKVIQTVIFTDLQLTVRALNGEKVGASTLLVNAASIAIRNARRRAGGIQVRLEWCPGHAGVKGGNDADRAARAASGGEELGTTFMPRKLAKFRPVKNRKTMKEDVKTRNIEVAREYWLKTKAGKKFNSKHPHVLAHTFLEKVRRLPRARSALFFQLTTGHAPLQDHLARLRVGDSRVCPHCGIAPETVAHYVLRCRAFAVERHQHLTSLGLEYLNLLFLLSSSSALSPLFNFIRATRRFVDLLG